MYHGRPRELIRDYHPSMFVERGGHVPLAATIKKHVKVPVACVGALNEPDQMEEIIASGKADVVEWHGAARRPLPPQEGHAWARR